MRQRHVPVRTCFVCGVKRPKHELVRIVFTATGECTVDWSKKLAGRGAYLCSEESCWQRAVKGEKLSHVLRGSIRPSDRERIAACAGGPPQVSTAYDLTEGSLDG